MKKINSAVLILKNSKFLKFYLNLLKKYDIKKTHIVNLDNKIKSKNKNIFKTVKKIKENFFLINSDFYPNENLFKLEKFFFSKRKSILVINKNNKENFKINLAIIKYSDVDEIFAKGNYNKFFVKSQNIIT